MLQRPSVSVIIATYNRAHYLAQTIDSVLSQGFRSFELIVVDDGSTDNTRELLRSYGDRLRFFARKIAGLWLLGNLGVHHARGEWIAIQDSDDLSRPNHLEVLFYYVAAIRFFMNFPVGYIDERVFGYRKHDGNTGRNEDLRLMENIRVIEKLVKNYPATRKLLGEQKLARRIAYRHYRLAKGRRKRGQNCDALQAIEKAVSLYPLSIKYWFYKVQWRMTEG
jgi:glycosyltransferase involved in cell wall biosynthesis